MLSRPIPASGEALPVIGCGTYGGFDVDPGSAAYARLPDVIEALTAAGGRVLDSSPMYGRAEAVVGELLTTSAAGRRVFLASKVWTHGAAAGERQMAQSLRRLGVDCIDLMQVHNLVDWRTHLSTLRDWKAQGRVRYVGVTHYSASAYDELERVMRREPLDFVQVNFALDDRAAGERILPLAAERGMAVLINLPFGAGRLLARLRGRALPAWAGEIGAATWPQLLLKFVLSRPEVTCVIPGSGNPEHMRDNVAAGRETPPPPEFWRGRVESILT